MKILVNVIIKKIIECIEMVKEREEKEINKNFVISVLNGLMNK